MLLGLSFPVIKRETMEGSNYSTSEDKAPFNMAIDTLRRIGEILRDIGKVSSDAMMSPAQKQSILVPMTQQLFFQASPLLPEDVVNTYKDQVLNLKAEQSQVGFMKGGVVKKKEIQLLYSLELEIKINTLLLDIQRELQKQKYFMPPKKDLSRAITEM